MINYTSHNLKALFKAIATHLVIVVPRIKDIGLLFKRYSVHVRKVVFQRILIDPNIMPKANVPTITCLEFGKTSKEGEIPKISIQGLFLFFVS